MRYDYGMNENRKAYVHVYETLKGRILHGDYAWQSRLPSKRELSKQFGVSLPTIEHALTMLSEEGYIRCVERSGSFVSYQKDEMFGIHDNQPVIVPNGIVDERAFPYTVFAKTTREVLSRYGEAVLGRSEGRGSAVLRKAIAAYLGRYRGMHVDENRIVIGAGSEYLYSIVVSLLGRARTYGIEDPSYDAIWNTYHYQDVVIEKLKLGDTGIESSELKKTNASILHVTPYHSYPSQCSTDESKRKEYIDWVNMKDRWIVEDDYESEFTPSIFGRQTLYDMDPERVIYMNTFSRTVSPSIRMSYMVLPEKLNARYESTQAFRSCTVSLLVQLIMAELLNNGAFERHLNRIRLLNRQEN